MELIWNDGGRASSGFVGLAGDCVTRSIAIATGTNYRDIYSSLGAAAEKSARDGVASSVASRFLDDLGWIFIPGSGLPFQSEFVPKGVVIVHLEKPDSVRCGHFCTLVDHVVHDTWNPSDEDDYVMMGYWIRPSVEGESTLPMVSSNRRASAEQSLTQKEFDKILHRLRALDNTANNHASTEGEKRNALRMMQTLMLRHNLSREDISDEDNVDNVHFARMACPVNGRRACGWEKSLALYLTKEIFPMTQCYFGVKGNRSFIWFYGPLEDVENSLVLFRELLLTIATAAHLQYGGHTRGSGASYAEGYVRGLPRYQTTSSETVEDEEAVISQSALILARSLAIHVAAKNWLKLECGISLVSERGSGRNQQDPTAASRGKQHGSTHDLSNRRSVKRITQS